jgi:Arc/MetJ-type ribon-helix-helix transcriptional regulator
MEPNDRPPTHLPRQLTPLEGEAPHMEEPGTPQSLLTMPHARSAEPRSSVVELSRESAQFLASLGRTIRESINQALEGRANVLMVRVNDETLRAIDQLVQAGLFKTRSEAAAFLLHEGMKARHEILDHVSQTARHIEELREQLRSALRGEVAPSRATEQHSADAGETPGSPVSDVRL